MREGLNWELGNIDKWVDKSDIEIKDLAVEKAFIKREILLMLQSD